MRTRCWPAQRRSHYLSPHVHWWRSRIRACEPGKVSLPGFDTHHGLEIGAGKVHIGTGGAAVQVLDSNTGEYRDSTLDDLYRMMRTLDLLRARTLRRASIDRARHADTSRSRYQYRLHLPACHHQTDRGELRQRHARGPGQQNVRPRPRRRGRVSSPTILLSALSCTWCHHSSLHPKGIDIMRAAIEVGMPLADLFGRPGWSDQSGIACRGTGAGARRVPGRDDGGRCDQTRAPLYLCLHAVHFRPAHRRDDRRQRRIGGRQRGGCTIVAAARTTIDGFRGHDRFQGDGRAGRL